MDRWLSTPGITAEAGIWQHIAVVYNGTNVDVYKNGQLGFNSNTTTFSDNTSGPMTVGDATFWGQLDEVRIWDVPRTQGDIQADLYGSVVGNEPGLLAYWRFDQKQPFPFPS